MAQGRVWLGSQAKDHGLVDRTRRTRHGDGTGQEEGQYPCGEQVSVVVYPAGRSILDILMRRSQQEDAIEARLAAGLRPHSVPCVDAGRVSADHAELDCSAVSPAMRLAELKLNCG